MTRDDLVELDRREQITADAEYDKLFEEIKQKNPTWSNERIYDEVFYHDLHKSNPETTLLENNPDYYKEDIKKEESKK